MMPTLPRRPGRPAEHGASGRAARSPQITLRISMSGDPAEPSDDEDATSPASLRRRTREIVDTLRLPQSERTSVLLDLATFDPSARTIVMQLRANGETVAEWQLTPNDLGLRADPVTQLRFQQFANSALLPTARQCASLLANVALGQFPGYVTPVLVDQLRVLLANLPAVPSLIAESLPRFVREPLKEALDIVDKERTMVWLELAEPLGYLSWLSWERLLRSVAGVPILRLSRQPLGVVAPEGALDVLLGCSTGDEKTPVPAPAVVALARGILRSLPAPGRCVVHLFADGQHRGALLQAFRASGLPFSEGDEPSGQRGVVLYRFPDADPAPGKPERAWTSWIRDMLQGRGIDVVHIISHVGFPGMQPALEIAEVPWAGPEIKRTHYVLKSSRMRIRRMNAATVERVASQLGAWAVVMSSVTSEVPRAQWALMHELSGLTPGVCAVHSLAADPEGGACRALYGFLARPSASRGVPPAIPDSPFLTVQCSPSRLERALASAPFDEAFGAGFADAAKRVQAVMDRREPTPAWLSVMQRQIEQAAATALLSKPTTERDKAAQAGVAAALTKAMAILADNSEPDGAPHHE